MDNKLKIRMMKTKVIFILLAVTAIIFTACQDEIAPPVITIHELGDGESHGNDHIAKIGGDLHMDIEVVAEGKIDEIRVRLHPEGEHQEGEGEHEEWEIDTIYTNFSGLKNTEFHEHVEIADWAEPGDYHFDFVVTDMEGNQSSADAELEIIEGEDDHDHDH